MNTKQRATDTTFVVDARPAGYIEVTAHNLHTLAQAIRRAGASPYSRGWSKDGARNSWVVINQDRAGGTIYGPGETKLATFTITPAALPHTFDPVVDYVGQRPRSRVRTGRAS